MFSLVLDVIAGYRKYSVVFLLSFGHAILLGYWALLLLLLAL